MDGGLEFLQEFVAGCRIAFDPMLPRIVWLRARGHQLLKVRALVKSLEDLARFFVSLIRCEPFLHINSACGNCKLPYYLGSSVSERASREPQISFPEFVIGVEFIDVLKDELVGR